MTSSCTHRGKGRSGGLRAARVGLLLAPGALLAALACGSQNDGPAADGSVERLTGTIQIPLVTPLGDQFRLRGAIFDITRANGNLVATLDSDSDPDATALSAQLDSGSYQITLRDGWSLERLGDAGGPVAAALLTPNPLSFAIENAQVTDIVYTFTTDGGIVTFGSGDLSVSVDVASSAPSASCSLLDSASCPAGQACLFSGDSGRTYCAVPGTLKAGSPCSSEQCVAGTQCLAVDASQPDARTCTRFCNPDRSGCGCRALAFDDDVGICTAAPSQDVTFGFTGDNCVVVDHEFTTGDDRGGIAVSDDFAYYTGDSATARFDLADLANQASIGTRFDGIVSDLDSGSLFSLAIDGSPFFTDFFPCNAGIGFNSLLELNPIDGSVQGSLPLSAPVPFDCSSGIFAGSGFVLLMTNFEVYRIDTNDGSVENLGPRPGFFANSCENWAFWGVAERVGDEYRLLYVSGSQILRTRLDGTTEVVSSFSNLSDMCSFTVSKPLGRWYFHYEGGAEFGGFGETVGFCDALIE